MNSARSYVFKMLEIIILGSLLTRDTSVSKSTTVSDDYRSLGSSHDIELETSNEKSLGSDSDAGSNSEQGESQETTRHDPLDLLLTGSTGTLIIRNLCALALNGKIDSRGRPMIKEESIAGRSIADDAYVQLRKILPSFKPVNTKGISLSIVQEDVAAEIFTALKNHYKKLPSTITGRMLKCGWSKEELPAVPSSEEDSFGDTGIDTSLYDAELDQEGAEKEDKERFTPGFIRKWWVYYQVLPSTARPLFCPHTGFKDAFVLMQERALPPILWGETKKNPNPAVPAATKIMTQGDANALVEHHYGALISRLFYGDKQSIKSSRSFNQTSYGKHTTTMESLSTNSPDKFSEVALQGYLEQKFAFIEYTKECRESDKPCVRIEPSLPLNDNSKSRYVVNNVLSTDGKQVHVVAFDTKTPYRLKSFNPIRRIEKQFPDKDSVL
ncbi:hypothetical protein BGX27_004916, partial [Mortierella sp. AM989]